ncbi:hypothetical protein EMIHUDRAFT_54259, partial [Emiliania huxleyi CCMP1516]|uniref:Protein kinase domain-containing protein n=2 Tax=Emiliania huxleyi TaxID=2903 RepID=A0A0D3IHZ8_EMIH1
QIGRGTFGVVRRARWQGADIAVKVVAADTSAAERKRAAGMLLKEAETLGRVRHPNVVHLLGVCTDYGSPMMLLPLATGTLVDELDAASASGVPMAVGRKLQLARDICAGMAALHSRGILHLDLKPANVLISRAEEALVADFGLSLQLRTTLTGASLAASALATAAGARGTMAYKAPELSRPKRKGGANYAKPCDVYSFAMLLWELFAGHPPWAGKPEMEIQAAHMDSFYGEEPLRPDLPSAPAKALELMVVSWSQDPAARPTFEALASEL